LDKNIVQVIIDFSVFRIGPVCPAVSGQPRNIIKRDVPKPHGRDESRAPGIGLPGIFHLSDLPV